MPPKIAYQILHEKVGDRHHDQGRAGQVRAEARKHLLEGGNHEDHDHCGNHERHDDDGERVEHRGPDLVLEREDLFLVGGKTVEQAVEYPGLLARADQVAEERVEVEGMLLERLLQARAGFHLGLDVHQQLGHGPVGVPLTHDVECLQQRDARLHHRRELPRKQRDVLVGDLAAATEPLPLHLADLDALPAQRGVDLSFAGRPHLPTHGLAGFVLAHPGEIEFLDARFFYCRSGCRCHTVTPRVLS